MLSRCVRSSVACLVAIVALGLVSVQRLNAQVLYGSVAGTVTDQTGAVVPGAAITIVNDNTGLSRSATSGSNGDYRVTDLPAGTYTLTATGSGFQPVKQTGINVTVGSVNQQNVQLTVGAVTQTVTVSGAAATLQTQEANVHTTISNYAVQNLPLNIYHNFQSVELLSPGVVSLSGFQDFGYPNALADTPDRSFAINSNGLPQHINTSRVDGATDVFLWLPDHMVIIPPASTVEEVNVQTANFNVQKGLTAGAATDVITKSGTNAFHGNIYGYHTDAALDAQNALVHTDSGKKPKNIQNNDGAAIGGPIIKNKVFFFGNWDGYFQRQNAADQNLIPPPDMRNGDFSAYLGAPLFSDAAHTNPIMVCTVSGGTTQLRQGMIFDPTTGNPSTGAGRCAFDNNAIPAGRMYAGSTNFWQLMAPFTPNTPVPGGFLFQNAAINDTRLRSSNWNRNIYTGKVDYNISDRQTLWGKYTLQKALLNDGTDYGVAGQGGGTGITDDTAQTVTIGHNWTAKSNLVLTGHIGFTRMGETNTTSDFGKPLGQSVLGLVNSNTPSGDVRYTGMPGIQFNDNWTTLGTNQSWEPVQRNDWQLTLDENATWIKGQHTIVFGFDASHNHMNHWQPEIVCCPRGNVITSDYNTFLNLTPGSAATVFDNTGTASTFNPAQWNSIAAFDLGLSSEVQNGQQFIKATNKDWDEALYVGDTFRITPKLTIDAGVRWEYYPLITRDGVSKFEVYDTATNQLYLGGLGNHDTHLGNTPVGVTSSKTLFAPRLGLAYQFNDKTVVRTAFGMTYDTLPLERPLRGFWPYTIGADDLYAPVGGNSTITQYVPFANFNTGTNTVNNIAGSPATATGLFNGVPLIQAPTGFESGIITPPGDVTIGTLAPGEFKRGYVEFWNFSVERKLPADILLNVAYVGNHLVHEFNGRDVNTAALGAGNTEPLLVAFNRPQSSGTFLFNGYLDSHYNSLQVSLNRHVTNGLFLQGAYTYSKVIGYMDDEGWENGLYFNCTPNSLLPQGCQSLNRHTLSFDHTHILKMAFIYTLPFGAGQKFATTGAASAVLGGWQLNGIVSGLSGRPLFPSQDASFLNTPGTSQVPDFAGNLTMTKGRGPGEQWFNTTAFTPIQTVQIGNGGRGLSWLRGPGLMQLDASLFRTFKVTERFRLKVRAEMLNFSNTPHWNNPGTTCTITSTGVCGGSFGQISSAFGQRILQLGAEVDF